MTILVYKSIIGRYELASISHDTGDGLTVIFEEPLDGKLIIGERVLNVKCGISKSESFILPDGDVTPRLVTSGGVKTLEGFISRRGEIIKKVPDAEYIRNIASALSALIGRVAANEAAIEKINEHINQKIEF